MQIHFKNKRGKSILSIQWNKLADILAWAKGLKNGTDFKNIDPAIPLIIEDAPEFEETEKPKEKTLSNIPAEKIITENINELKLLYYSLQKEFEFMLSKDYVNNFVLEAKKKQIDSLKFIIDEQDEILDSLIREAEKLEKAELCLINFGVSELEYVLFISPPLKEIEAKMLEYQKEGSVQKPEIFRSKKSQPEEIRISDKPVLDWKKIMSDKKTGLKVPINYYKK